MSKHLSGAELERIILSSKDDNDIVYWSYFVSEAKDHIIASSESFETTEKHRNYWNRLFSNSVTKLGFTVNFGLDNWFMIERQIAVKNSAASASTSAMIPPPISTSMPARVSQQKKSSSPASSTSSLSPRSASSLGTLLSEVEREAALSRYNKMEDEHKWKLKSGRYVEDVMADVVITQVYEHPVLHCILDMTDDNWTKIFSKDELKELNQVTNVEIKYPALPKDMVDFMKNMPTTSNLGEIYNHLESQQLDFYRQQHLIWVKSHVQSAIQLFKRGYLPINDQSERDICAKVWGMISDAFDDSIMTVRMEKASQASKESNNKKRKLALIDSIERQQSPLVPDMSVLFGTQEFALVEAAKTKNDTKELVDGGKKCPLMMSQVFEQLLSLHPTERRSIKVYGFLLSRLNCTPLELSSSFGYVRILKKGRTVQHPEMPQSFKAQMTKLLAQVWQFRLATERVVEAMIASENENNEFIN